MKTKSFREYLGKRLTKSEITDIERQAKIELQAIKLLQKDISKGIEKYMTQEGIGFNELVRRLGISPTQVLKILKGEANLTLATIAHIAALFKKRPHLIFE